MRTRQRNDFSASGAIARARTKLTIASDRLDCGQEELQQMQREITDILSKYLNLDRRVFEVRMDIVCRTKRGVQDVKTIQIK